MGHAQYTSADALAGRLMASTPVLTPVVHERVELDDGYVVEHAEISVEHLLGQGFRVSGRVNGELYWYSSHALRIWCVELADGQIVYVRLDSRGGRPGSAGSRVLNVVDGTGARVMWPGSSPLTPNHKEYWNVIQHLSGDSFRDTGLSGLV